MFSEIIVVVVLNCHQNYHPAVVYCLIKATVSTRLLRGMKVEDEDESLCWDNHKD